MSSITKLKFDNGVVIGLGVNVDTDIDLILPVNSIINLSDKELVRMIRGAIPHAARAYAAELIAEWENYFKHAPESAIIQYLEELEPHHDSVEEVRFLCRMLRMRLNEIQGKKKPTKSTKRAGQGFIYLAYCETGQYKIGKSIEPKERIRVFDTKMPVKVELVYVFPADDMAAAEKELHSRYADKHHTGEWFNLSEDDEIAITCIVRYEDGEWIY